VDRVIGVEGVEAEIVMLRTPDRGSRVELSRFLAPATPAGDPPAPANARGIRHVSFVVEDIEAILARLAARGFDLVGELERYGDSYRLCYVRGPEGILVELAEEIGPQ
jgi:catechol 2,3-dioxygenase-like lactoylglutathione lyase family enzyme